MTNIRPGVASGKSIFCLIVVVLCLLAGLDGIWGSQQSLNVSCAEIQSAYSLDDSGGGHGVRAISIYAAHCDADVAARQTSFSRNYLEGIPGRSIAVYLNISPNRAPPSIS